MICDSRLQDRLALCQAQNGGKSEPGNTPSFRLLIFEVVTLDVKDVVDQQFTRDQTWLNLQVCR